MKEKHHSQKQFEQALEKAKKLSVQLEKNIEADSKERDKYNAWVKTAETARDQWRQNTDYPKRARDKQADGEQSFADQSRRRANKFQDQVTLATLQKKALDDAIAIAESFHNSVKDALPQNQNLQDDAIVDQKNKAIYDQYTLAARTLNEMLIKEIDPPFNYKKIPGIFLTVGGSLTFLAGLGIWTALGKFALYGVYLAWVIATPISLPLTLMAVGVGACIIGGILWHLASKSDPAEKTIGQTKEGLTKINNTLEVALAENNPTLSVEPTSTSKQHWGSVVTQQTAPGINSAQAGEQPVQQQIQQQQKPQL